MVATQNIALGLALAALACTASTAGAVCVTFDGSVGSRTASASFSASGADLVITLRNLSVTPASSASELLTGVFFNINGASESFTRVSAAISNTPIGPANPNNAVLGNWGFKSGLVGVPGGVAYGLGSTQLGLFGPNETFPTSGTQGYVSNSDDSVIPGGLDDTSSGSPGGPLAGPSSGSYTAVFTLSNLSSAFSPSLISNVRFQYGTALTDPSIPGAYLTTVPLPGAAGAGLATFALIFSRRRRR